MPPPPASSQLKRCPHCGNYTRGSIIQVKYGNTFSRALHQTIPVFAPLRTANARICSHCRGTFDLQPDHESDLRGLLYGLLLFLLVVAVLMTALWMHFVREW